MDQAILRKAATAHGFAVVDLPALFTAHTGSELPDRRLFLDYCHLTQEGIQVAMAGVTTAVLRFTESDRDPTDIHHRVQVPVLSSEAEATAMFGAAIHTAHRLLGVRSIHLLLTHWCTRALHTSPSIADTMVDLVDARTAPVPAVMTAAQQRNLASPYRLTFQHGWRYPYLDLELIQALIVALAEVHPSARVTIQSLLFNRLGLPKMLVELAVPGRYNLHPLEQFYPEVMPFDDLPRRVMYRAVCPVSRFGFISDAQSDATLHLTARLSEMSTGPYTLHVNGRTVKTLPLQRTWTRHRVTLPRILLKPGINHLALYWPMPVLSDTPMEPVAKRLMKGQEATVHPVFGEVFSLKVAI